MKICIFYFILFDTTIPYHLEIIILKQLISRSQYLHFDFMYHFDFMISNTYDFKYILTSCIVTYLGMFALFVFDVMCWTWSGFY